jgi:hypothetical protein
MLSYLNTKYIFFCFLHRKIKTVGPPENLVWAPTDRKRPINLSSQPISSVVSKNSRLLRQRTKTATDKSVRRTVFGRLEHNPYYLLVQQIKVFGVKSFKAENGCFGRFDIDNFVDKNSKRPQICYIFCSQRSEVICL